ncbi:hypothetical protein TCAL_14427 [Tigriopus californicus]|uniref:EF-hand domain-containing protein n=1 Tax=Tigriopus californicus TaxID=6832 RepID=A0A553PK31_TIGCA|nr:hypothetical protein TCAL_14427 [Tigriopus californicus]
MPSSWASTLWMGAFVWGVVINGQQRTVPGVNPNQYQGGQGQGHPPPPPPPQQQQPQQFAQMPPQQQQPQHQQQHQQQQQQFVQQAQQFAGPPHTGNVPQGQQFQQPPGAPMAPAPGGGGHHAHGQPQRVLHRDVKHEREHMKEHMDVPIDTSNMSEEELQFHYFKMHDADGNNKLDGCELVKSLIHWHGQ